MDNMTKTGKKTVNIRVYGHTRNRLRIQALQSGYGSMVNLIEELSKKYGNTIRKSKSV